MAKSARPRRDDKNDHAVTVTPVMPLATDADATAQAFLEQIAKEEQRLNDRLGNKLVVNEALDRKLVSFQANKSAAWHRWCKYKEGFSAALVRYIFDAVGLREGTVLEPFAGSGTTLFTASD